MQVQIEVLERLLKEKNMSQAQLCRKANVSQNAISNWKKGGHEARKSVVSRVAKALGTSIKQLTEPETAKYDFEDMHEEVTLELLAHHYGISTNTIIKLAPLMFSVIARRAVKTRINKLDDWFKKLQEAAPIPEGIKTAYSYKSSNEELDYSSFAETYWEERKRRENGDLSADFHTYYEDGDCKTIEIKDMPEGAYGFDLFFEALEEIDIGDAIGDSDDWRANLKNFDENESFFYNNDWYDLSYNIAPGGIAQEFIMEGIVRVSEIPENLFDKRKEDERIDWIVSKGKNKLKTNKAKDQAITASENTEGDKNA